MIIDAGFRISFQCPVATPILMQLNVHPSRVADLQSGDIVQSDPPLPIRSYFDLYGNQVTRTGVPPGLVTFYNRFRIYDHGQPDEKPAPHELTPISQLPDDVLLYLVSSRYCDSDALSPFAWSKFGQIADGSARVQAICDFVHGHIQFNYALASPRRTATDALREQVGVCRDFAHLAVALCRAMNVPARYATGYLGDIGVPVDVNPMDFSAWFEVYLDGRWWTMDARHNRPRIGRIVMGRGRDAADVAITTAFGVANLTHFEVITDEVKA